MQTVPLATLRQQISAASPPARRVRLLAVSTQQPTAAVAALAAQGQRALGENYVQEAAGKVTALAGRDLEWHLIGHLQSNKAALAAGRFDGVQRVYRPGLVQARTGAGTGPPPAGQPPLNVLIQVNIDDEDSKHGCAPACVDALAAAITGEERLCLRGLMALPAPLPDRPRRQTAFMRMWTLFDALAAMHRQADTLCPWA